MVSFLGTILLESIYDIHYLWFLKISLPSSIFFLFLPAFLLNKYFLSICCVPGMLVGAGDTAENGPDKFMYTFVGLSYW